MKHLSEYRTPQTARRLADDIHRLMTRPWSIMEVCGGQTHSIVRNGVDQILPSELEFIHGPGCPVCVTPVETINQALALAALPEVTFCSFGDMLRVPGSGDDLFAVRSRGGDVRIVYSPLDAIRIAQREPHRQVVFFAIGFETTAPANAMAAKLAQQLQLPNFSMLVSHVLVPPAVEMILRSPTNRVQGLLAAGHVCSVMGTHEYQHIVQQFRIPVVVTGFEVVDLLEGIRQTVQQLESHHAELINAYPRVVSSKGNPEAQSVVGEVFQTCDRHWRGIGMIPNSGLEFTERFQLLDALRRFDISPVAATNETQCRSGEVLTGVLKPVDCPAFGKECTPSHPLGATMVSSEGACAAYYHCGRLANAEAKPE